MAFNPRQWDKLIALGFQAGSQNPEDWLLREVERLRAHVEALSAVALSVQPAALLSTEDDGGLVVCWSRKNCYAELTVPAGVEVEWFWRDRVADERGGWEGPVRSAEIIADLKRLMPEDVGADR